MFHSNVHRSSGTGHQALEDSVVVRIGVVAKLNHADFVPRLKEVLQWLHDRGCQTVVEEQAAQQFDLEGVTPANREDLPHLSDVIVVFGGDGALLSMARLIRDRKARILGVNLGSLGFLTGITLDELRPTLDCLLQGNYSIDRRRMLKAEVHDSGSKVVYHALNDLVISNKSALARIVSVETFVGQEFVANFLADGVIISTPTGSTAYSLSAGGPVVYPTLDAILITPICPHTLTNRPLVIPSSSQVRLVIKSGEDLMLTVDGQEGIQLKQEDEIHCTGSEYEIELIRTHDKGFFDVLRAKLKWGER